MRTSPPTSSSTQRRRRPHHGDGELRERHVHRGRESDDTTVVTLSADPERTVVIPIETTDQGGATSGRLHRRPAERDFQQWRSDLHLAAEADTENDDGESVRLSFATVTAGTPAQATVITDDDVPCCHGDHASYNQGGSDRGRLTIREHRAAERHLQRTRAQDDGRRRDLQDLHLRGHTGRQWTTTTRASG